MLHKHIENIPVLQNSDGRLYDACEKGKAHRQSCNGTMKECTAPGKIFYSDVAGPYVSGIRGEKYLIAFTDAFSEYSWVITTPDKKFVTYYPSSLNEVRQKFDIRVLQVNADKGKEYLIIENTFKNIKLTTTTGYNPQHNPTAKRMNSTLKDPTRAMLVTTNLQQTF